MWPMAEKMAGLFSPRSTALCSSRSASSALPSRCRETAVARDRERPPFSSAKSFDPIRDAPGLPDEVLLTTDNRGVPPASTGLRFTELILLPSFLFAPEPIVPPHSIDPGATHDSFGTRTEHSLPRKSLFLVTFIQYS